MKKETVHTFGGNFFVTAIFRIMYIPPHVISPGDITTQYEVLDLLKGRRLLYREDTTHPVLSLGTSYYECCQGKSSHDKKGKEKLSR